ncbi:CD1247 N-terminal domain-containing protein [uncultured Ruminococcus sp.]|uniref:CD1247 N-terminal domain-containing protein n=1 Tax=uncultured Ruminococcus sp. TaxID=165186 RepID=UPI002671B212|nr:CD1247 N-terminal domain-containing protein [uncultured Ruminococcus sp.]
MELSKKVAYLKGLMEGLKIDDSTNEGKILTIMADILDEMSATVEDIAEEVDETVELVDTLDEDLGEIEDLIYGDDDDDAMYECVCPNCGDTIMLGENIIADGSVECPNCGESLEFDFSEIEDEDNED